MDDIRTAAKQNDVIAGTVVHGLAAAAPDERVVARPAEDRRQGKRRGEAAKVNRVIAFVGTHTRPRIFDGQNNIVKVAIVIFSDIEIAGNT